MFDLDDTTSSDDKFLVVFCKKEWRKDMMMKKITVISAMCIIAIISSNAIATITWEGLDWTPNPSATSVAVNIGTGNLEVVAGATGGGWAQYPVPGQNPGFTTDYFRIGFDLDATVNGGANSTIIQVANYDGTNQAQIMVHLQQQTVFFDDNSDNTWSSIPVAALPTTGLHSLTFQRDSVSGLVSITLDDSTLIWQATAGLEMDGLDYLRAGAGDFAGGGGSAVYTSATIPEPTTMALLGLGCMAIIKKRK